MLTQHKPCLSATWLDKLPHMVVALSWTLVVLVVLHDGPESTSEKVKHDMPHTSLCLTALPFCLKNSLPYTFGCRHVSLLGEVTGAVPC